MLFFKYYFLLVLRTAWFPVMVCGHLVTALLYLLSLCTSFLYSLEKHYECKKVSKRQNKVVTGYQRRTTNPLGFLKVVVGSIRFLIASFNLEYNFTSCRETISAALMEFSYFSRIACEVFLVWVGR